MSAPKPSGKPGSLASRPTHRSDSSATLRLVAGGGNGPVTETRAQRIEREARAAVLKSAGLGECCQLCDVAQVEHVCDLVLEEFAAAHLAMDADPRAGFTKALQRNLIDPLVRYAGTLVVPRRPDGVGAGVRMEAQPTDELIAAARQVQLHLVHGPWADADARQAAQLLEAAWLKWIAYVASYWMWNRVPDLLVQKQVRSEQGRLGKGVPRSGPTRSTSNKEKIIETAKRLAKSKASHELAGAVAQQLDVTPQWVRRVLNADKKKANLDAAL